MASLVAYDRTRPGRACALFKELAPTSARISTDQGREDADDDQRRRPRGDDELEGDSIVEDPPQQVDEDRGATRRPMPLPLLDAKARSRLLELDLAAG